MNNLNIMMLVNRPDGERGKVLDDVKRKGETEENQSCSRLMVCRGKGGA